LVISTDCVLVLPTATSPKFMLVGFTPNCKTGASPLPDRETVVGEFVASLTIERLPTAAPGEAGTNCTLKELLCPGEIARGRVRPLVLNPAPLTVAWVTITTEPPVFVRVIACVLLLLATTSPKLMLDGFTVS
jgi:hypothetical protein